MPDVTMTFQTSEYDAETKKMLCGLVLDLALIARECERVPQVSLAELCVLVRGMKTITERIINRLEEELDL